MTLEEYRIHDFISSFMLNPTFFEGLVIETWNPETYLKHSR